MAKQKFKVGDKIVFGRCKRNRDLTDVTIGKIYVVDRIDYDPMFIDDAGDYNYAFGADGCGKATKIIASA